MATADGTFLLETIAYCLGDNGRFYQETLQQRFGLNAREPFSLRALSEDVGISRERVRQIERSFLTQYAAELKARPGMHTYWPHIFEAIQRSDQTWRDASRRVGEVLGFPVYLPSIYQLAASLGIHLPEIGFDKVAAARKLDEESVRYRLELSLGRRFSAKDVKRWLTPPPSKQHEDAPVEILRALVAADNMKEPELPDDLRDLSQPELIRELMQRSGFSRRQMMDYLYVQQSTFDRWLWPAENPTPIPFASRVALARLAHDVPAVPVSPRKRHLGPRKAHSLNGVAGLVRHSMCRDTESMIAFYRRDQAANLPKESVGPWTTVCETHRVLVDWPRFADGFNAMAQSREWCPDCAALPAVPQGAEPVEATPVAPLPAEGTPPKRRRIAKKT